VTAGRATAPHDLALLTRLRALALAAGPGVREGRMFGCPALLVGRRMPGCVVGDEAGLRVPEAQADLARRSGRARPFAPYGKRPMREWIAITGDDAGLESVADLLRAAAECAASHDAGPR